MQHRHRVLGLLSLLSVITYLDRVCISIAGPRMQEALSLGPQQWGWVTGVFTLAYALFEIPSGSMGDRIGPRRVLTRIVLWWSAFTSLTGAVSSYVLLVLVRFCFGMGEAGAYPNIGVSISRWFPLRERTTAYGIVLMAAQVGGALAPLLVVPIQASFGWRASFMIFGVAGVLWSVAWYTMFRDFPSQVAEASEEELAIVAPVADHRMPWAEAVRSSSLWAVVGMAGCVGYTMSFFQSWLGTYLVKARGFTETGLLFASLPFLVGALANMAGGWIGDALVRRSGLRFGRKAMLVAGYGGGAVFLALATQLADKYAALAALSFAYGGITLAQPALMSVCLDIGGKYSGAVTGAMNTLVYLCAFLSSVLYGYMVDYFGNYEVAFIPMVVFMTAGTLVALRVDAERKVVMGA